MGPKSGLHSIFSWSQGFEGGANIYSIYTQGSVTCFDSGVILMMLKLIHLSGEIQYFFYTILHYITFKVHNFSVFLE